VRFEEQRIRAEADRRMEEAERLQNEAAPPPSLNALGEPPAPEPEPVPAAPAEPSALAPDLSVAEQRIQEGREARERSMQEAEHKLAEIDERTKAAEARAAAAVRLQAARAEEEEQQRKLEEMQRSVEEAEVRAREAEQRAREAEEAVLRSIGAPPSAPAATPAPQPAIHEVPAPQEAAQDVTPLGFSPAPPPADLDSGSTAPIGLNSVTFEELRSQGLSVTQSTRLLAHRERLGGFSSVDDLDQVAGFPPDLLATVKSRATL
jgi:DNA uptake protein ComE-like DNA-binding protein